MGKTLYQYSEHSIAAGAILEVATYGRFLTLLDNSSATDVKVQIGENHKEQDLPKGLSVELADAENAFTRLRFRNPTGGAITLKFSISTGRVYDNRVTISGELNVDPSTDTIETPAKVTATAVAAAVNIPSDGDQREIIIENHSANIIWLGDADVDGAATRGIRLFQSTKIVLSTSAAIYLHAPAGASDLTYMRLTK